MILLTNAGKPAGSRKWPTAILAGSRPAAMMYPIDREFQIAGAASRPAKDVLGLDKDQKNLGNW